MITKILYLVLIIAIISSVAFYKANIIKEIIANNHVHVHVHVKAISNNIIKFTCPNDANEHSYNSDYRDMLLETSICAKQDFASLKNKLRLKSKRFNDATPP